MLLGNTLMLPVTDGQLAIGTHPACCCWVGFVWIWYPIELTAPHTQRNKTIKHTGRWQSVMMVELDGPRERTVGIQVAGFKG